MSTRTEIIIILCDTDIFPVGCKLDIRQIQDIVKHHLTQTKAVEDINHSIRQAVETIYDYKGYKSKRVVILREGIYEFQNVL